MITVPASFRTDSAAAHAGTGGRAWLDGLPALVGRLCDGWGLLVDGEPRHGWSSLALPVRRGSVDGMLRVTWPEQGEPVAHQIAALRAWDGHGAMRLLDAAPADSAMLLERLDPHRSLAELPPSESLVVAAGLLRRLAVPAPAGDLPTVAGVARELVQNLPVRSARFNHPVPPSQLERVRAIARDLTGVGGDRLVHHDLSDDNVLRAGREPWLAVDPRVAVGPLEYGVPELLWGRYHRLGRQDAPARALDLVVRTARLDPDLARAWTAVRTLDFLLWGLAHGITSDREGRRPLLDHLVPPIK